MRCRTIRCIHQQAGSPLSAQVGSLCSVSQRPVAGSPRMRTLASAPRVPILRHDGCRTHRNFIPRKLHALRRSRRFAERVARRARSDLARGRLARSRSHAAVDCRRAGARMECDEGPGCRVRAARDAGARAHARHACRRRVAGICGSWKGRDHHRPDALAPVRSARARLRRERPRSRRSRARHRGAGTALGAGHCGWLRPAALRLPAR